MASLLLSDRALELIASRFRVLGEPTRLRLLQHVQGGERSVNDLATLLGATQPNVSKHLKLLFDAGLVARRQAGTSVLYRIADPTVFQLCELVCEGMRDHIEDEAKSLRGG